MVKVTATARSSSQEDLTVKQRSITDERGAPEVAQGGSEAARGGSEPASTATTLRRRQTQERLLDAAYEVLARDGLDGASVERICEAAGFSRGAFYSNFETKTELFLELIEREHARRLEHLRSAVLLLRDAPPRPSGELSVEQVTELVERVLGDQPSERDWFCITMQFELLALRQPEVAPRFLGHERQMVRELATVLEDVAAALGQRFVIDSMEATSLLMAGYASAAKHALLLGVPDHAAEVRRLIGEWLPAIVSRLVEPVEGA